MNSKPSIVVTGAKGQLGQSLKRELSLAGFDKVEYIDIEDLDLANQKGVAAYFETHPCDILINCAAYTAVDKAEEEPNKAMMINAMVPMYLGEQAAKNKFKIIHISTDYVFSGTKNSPYVEEDTGEEDKAGKGPINQYGKTKLVGELLLQKYIADAVIIRTSWLYSEFGKNFVKTMINKAAEDTEVKVVNDQFGSPTYAGDLARAIIEMIQADEWQGGVFHFCNSGAISWRDFAAAVYEEAGKDKDMVSAIPTESYPTLARRPKYSVLDTAKIRKTFGIDIPEWRESLRRCMENLKN